MHLTVSPNIMQCMPYGFPKNHRAMQKSCNKKHRVYGNGGIRDRALRNFLGDRFQKISA